MQTNFLDAYASQKLKLLTVRETPVYRVSTDPSNCTMLELLAALIGGPKQIEIAEAVLAHFRGDLHLINQAPVSELVSIPGVGGVTAARLRSAFVLSSRLALASMERIEINSPSDAASLCTDMSTFDVEHLRLIALNTKNKVLGVLDVYKGSVNSSQVRVGEVFRYAIQRNASAVICAHNHPSGETSVSPDDVSVTRALRQAGKLLDIELLDHLIIGYNNHWASLKEKGLMT